MVVAGISPMGSVSVGAWLCGGIHVVRCG